MTKHEFFEELLSELSYRVDEGLPILSNPRHIQVLSEILDEWGLYSIKNELLHNLVNESDYETPILNKEIEYKNSKGETQTGSVGDLLRTGEDTDSRQQAEKYVPEKGTPERDKIDDDLGDEGKPDDGEATKDTDVKGGEDDTTETPEEERGTSITQDKDTLSRFEKEKKAAQEDELDEGLLVESALTTGNVADSRYWPVFMDTIKNEKDFLLDKGGTIVIPKSFLNSTGNSGKKLKDYDDPTQEEMDAFFKKGNSYEKMIPSKSGKVYKLNDLSKSTLSGISGGKSGVPSSSDWYELGIAVEYNKKQGMSREAAMKAADVDPKKYERYEEHLTEVCSKIVNNLPKMGSQLRQTGADRATPAPVWPSSDGTPKTDIFGDINWRISLKKQGGSQLASGGKDDALGIFQAALAFYQAHDNSQVQRHLNDVVSSIENDFKSFISPTGVGDIRKDAGDAYVEWRVPQLKREVPKASRNDIERHAKAEATAVGIIGERGNWNDWFIEDVEQLGEREVMKWFETYWKSKGTDELKEEVKDVVQAAIDHKRIANEMEKAFQAIDFKKWCVYEASSGTYKFSGSPSLTTTNEAIANKLMVFDLLGNVDVKDINETWAKGYSSNVKAIVSFKTSGKSKWTAMRLIQEDTNPKTITFSNDLYDIITEESDNMNRYINESIEDYNELLNEIDFSKAWKSAKNIAKRLMKKITDSIKRFYDNIIKRAVNKLKDWAMTGIESFLEYLGIDFSGTAELQIKF